MKSQAQIAGRLDSSLVKRPEKGTVLRDVELQLVDGRKQLLSQLRGRKNLVMIFNAGADLIELVNQLVACREGLQENEAEVLILHKGEQGNFPEVIFETAQDPEGTLHRQLGAVDGQEKLTPTVYVTDRFGEIFAGFRRSENKPLPNANEIISWLEFINQQCEECNPPEWR
jgi:hypothetical protein